MLVSTDYKPDEKTAAAAIHEWIKSYVPNTGEEPPFQTLTKEQQKRLGYRGPRDKTIIHLFNDEATWLVWSTYFALIPKRMHDPLRFILSKSNYASKERLEGITMIYKKYQHLLSPDWTFYIDLGTLGDYVKELTYEQVLEKLKPWVQEVAEHDLPDFDFYKLYRLGSDMFTSTSYQPPIKEQITVETFLSDPKYWATTGSSDGIRLTGIDGTRARKSKWATAYASKINYLFSLFMSRETQRNRVSTKRELGKPRLIIAGDLPNYLRMAYISYWLEDVLRDHPNTTLFYNKAQTLTLWIKMIEGTIPIEQSHSDKDPVNLTLDESKFDHMVNSRMLLINLLSIQSFIENYCITIMKYPMLLAIDLIIRSLVDQGYVLVRNIDGKIVYIPIKNGILSGWRWTALLDTISNFAKVIAFRIVTMLRNGTSLNEFFLDPITNFTSQGDDLRSKSRSYMHAETFTKLYAESGFQVHPKKFFVSPYADEFLRKVALYGQKLIGYPARGVATLIFRNPIRSAPLEGESRIRERIANWLVVYRRTQIPFEQFQRHILKDVSQMTNFSKDTLRTYMHAMSNAGGMGIQPYNNMTIKFTNATYKQANEPAHISELILNMTSNPELQRNINKDWTSAISWKKPKTIIIKDKIEIIDTPKNENIKFYAPKIHSRTSSPLYTGPKPIDGLTPSLVDAFKLATQQARRKDKLMIAEQWMDQPSLSQFSKIMTQAGYKIQAEWLSGDLLGKVPDSNIAGPIFMSPTYQAYARCQINEVFMNAKVKYHSLISARKAAEQLTWDAYARSKHQILE